MTTTQLDQRPVRAAIGVAGHAPSVHNTQPWVCRLGPDSIEVHADPSRWLPYTDRDRRDLLLSCGALLHHLEVALAGVGVGVDVDRLPDRARPLHLATLHLRPGHELDEAVRHSATIAVRRSDRRPYSDEPVHPEQLRQLADSATDRGALLRVVDADADGDRLQALIEHARLDQEAGLDYQAELARWSGRSLSADGIPAANLLEPTGPRWNRDRSFPAGRTPVPVGTAPDAATYVVLATTSDDTLSRLRAGEALSAVLLQATEMGLASCPLSQPLEVPSTRLQLRDDLLRGAASPQLLVRLGWTHSGAPLPPTPRRAVDDFVVAASSGHGDPQPWRRLRPPGRRPMHRTT